MKRRRRENGEAGENPTEPTEAPEPAGPLLLPPPSGDHALKTRAEDELGRAPLAEAIAAHVASVGSEDAVVFGVLGPWGSGKTSLLGMIGDSLRNEHGVLVAYFNPWLFSGAEGLVGFFFAELGAGLGDLSGKPVQDLGASMQDYGELLGSVRTDPTVGGQAAAAGGSLKIFGGRLKGAADERVSLLERKNRVADALERLGRNLVVMVDDPDRLRREEVRDVVALVRLNADLPHLVFVLAYDRTRVEQALAKEEGDGRSYLEKIVQVVHDVPEARAVDVKSALVDAFTEVTDAAAEMGPYDSERVGEVLNEIVFPLVGTLRGVKRYANALPVTLRAVGDEVALADVLALEAIRLFMPEVYSGLSASAEALTTPSDAYIVSSFSGRQASEPWSKASHAPLRGGCGGLET